MHQGSLVPPTNPSSSPALTHPYIFIIKWIEKKIDGMEILKYITK
jgi:hypothetical protein